MVNLVGIFTRSIKRAYDVPGVPMAISTPYSSQDFAQTLTADLLPAELRDGSTAIRMTREIALSIPALNRAHGVHVTQFAENPFYMMRGNQRAADAEQPRWTYTTDSGVPLWNRWSEFGSDMFFEGWGCLSFTADMQDCMHVPWGHWGVRADRSVWVDTDIIPAAYAARPVPIQVGGGWTGVLNSGIRAIDQARKIEDAYQKRLENPIPLTVLNIPFEQWQRMTPEERKVVRDQWTEGRRKGEVATKPTEWGVEMPGQIAVDLYETGRNGSRLDIANATSTPADLLEGAKQGGSGGTNMRYQGVGETGATRSDLWDFGLAKRFTLAVEARLSLDDIVPSGYSIRADRSAVTATPTPATNPTSQD